jgi:hypothetical protein
MKFTGKERDAESGLDYFGARYMSSAQGRFTTPDWPNRVTPLRSLFLTRFARIYEPRRSPGSPPMLRSTQMAPTTHQLTFGTDAGGTNHPQ